MTAFRNTAAIWGIRALPFKVPKVRDDVPSYEETLFAALVANKARSGASPTIPPPLTSFYAARLRQF